MKKLFHIAICNILLIPTVSLAKVKEFKYLQKVKVVSGFYEGCTGIIKMKENSWEYLVDLTCSRDGSMSSTYTDVLAKDMQPQ